jgi:hypothetical protein
MQAIARDSLPPPRLRSGIFCINLIQDRLPPSAVESGSGKCNPYSVVEKGCTDTKIENEYDKASWQKSLQQCCSVQNALERLSHGLSLNIIDWSNLVTPKLRLVSSLGSLGVFFIRPKPEDLGLSLGWQSDAFLSTDVNSFNSRFFLCSEIQLL